MPPPHGPLDEIEGSPRPSRARRALRHRLFPVAVAAGALLLFLWPLVRAPTLSLWQAWGHLAVAWGLLIVTLLAMARALASAPDEEDSE